MTARFSQFQCVTLARDVPDKGLSAGATVVILDVYDDGAAYEVEVLDDRAETVFVGSLPHDALVGEASSVRPAPMGDFAALRPALLRRMSQVPLLHAASQACFDYMALLPRHRIARCPISGNVLERAIDTVDLDGPWWDFRAPARPPSTHFATLVALTGAVRLHHVPHARFLVVPGPERPFVVPRLLDIEGVQAVISWLPIGAHHGYPIAYFAPPPGPSLAIDRLNDWGACSYRVQGPEQIEEKQDHPYEAEWDYDLGPWIDSGRLLWIAPGDATLQLRSTREDCPYLALGGRRGITSLQDGDAWWPDDVD